MTEVKYEKSSDLQEAIKQVKQENVHLLAGGTDLLVGMKDKAVRPEGIFDVKGISELNTLEETEEGLVIGGAATLNQTQAFVQDKLPVLAEACHSVGSYPIRNRATLVGNICTASPAADTAPALLVLGAKVRVAGENETREIAIEDFFTGPKQNALQDGEIVTSVVIPKPYPNGKGMYYKTSRTYSVDLSTVGVAIQNDGDSVRIGLGAMGPTPMRAYRAEKAFNEEGVTDYQKVADLIEDEISPIDDLRGSAEYRRHMAKVSIKRGLEETMKGE